MDRQFIEIVRSATPRQKVMLRDYLEALATNRSDLHETEAFGQ